MVELDNTSERAMVQVGEALEKSQRSENQDMVFSAIHEDMLVTGVFDGHGGNGRMCASHTRDDFKSLLCSEGSVATAAVAGDLDDAMRQMITDAFATVHGNLEKYTADKAIKVNAKFSGTTAVVAMVGLNRVTVANVGDSDCILGSAGENGSKESLEARLLNPKHLLVVEEEKLRIEAAGGRVQRQRKKDGTEMSGGPLRVWLQEIQTPGLMVSRSIGDIMCHEVGVSAEPGIVQHVVAPNDLMLILGSDGLWEFVEPLVAVQVVEDYLSATDAAGALATMALAAQTSQNADNISVVVVHLETPEARAKRLEAQPDFEARNAARQDEVEELRIMIKKAQTDALNGIIKSDKELPSTGSMMYGGMDAAPKPAEPSVIDTGSESEHVTTKKSSGICVIS